MLVAVDLLVQAVVGTVAWGRAMDPAKVHVVATVPGALVKYFDIRHRVRLHSC